MPLLDLIPLVDIHVPIYDLKETLQADQDDYLDQLDYIA